MPILTHKFSPPIPVYLCGASGQREFVMLCTEMTNHAEAGEPKAITLSGIGEMPSYARCLRVLHEISTSTCSMCDSANKAASTPLPRDNNRRFMIFAGRSGDGRSGWNNFIEAVDHVTPQNFPPMPPAEGPYYDWVEVVDTHTMKVVDRR